MKTEWKTTVRVGIITGLVMASLLSPMFLVKSLLGNPIILVGMVALFPVAGFIAGRKAAEHPIWVSVISALVASLGIMILGITTLHISSDASASSERPAHAGMLLVMAKMMFQMWIQQTAVLTALSTAGGALALLINKKQESSNQTNGH